MLCEGCGYDLKGLGQDAVCPECARPVEQSQPQRRLGSPWQVRPGVASWLRTGVLSLFRPHTLFDRIQIERRRSQPLFYLNLAIATLMLLSLTAAFGAQAGTSVSFPTAGGGTIVVRGRGAWWSI